MPFPQCLPRYSSKEDLKHQGELLCRDPIIAIKFNVIFTTYTAWYIKALILFSNFLSFWSISGDGNNLHTREKGFKLTFKKNLI